MRSTKAERMEAHRLKMEMRGIKNHQNCKDLAANPEYVFANQSIHHENYNETPAEQTARMLEKSS